MRRWVIPIAVAGALLFLAAGMARLPEHLVSVVRLANGFAIVAFLAWVIHGQLRYERQLAAHRTEILALIERGETNRARSITNLMEQTEHIASDLSQATERLAETVRRDHQTGQAEIVDKLVALESKVNGTTP